MSDDVSYSDIVKKFTGQDILFFGKIEKVIEQTDGVIVQLAQDPKTGLKSVEFINKDGSRRWQIDRLVDNEYPDKIITSCNGAEFIINGIKIYFQWDIRKVVEHIEGAAVMLRAMSGRSEANVYFVNNDGTIRWQIKPLVSPDDPNKKEIGYVGYTWIGYTDKGELEADSFLGVRCKVNLINGSVYDCVGER